jgi:hypothetical protein
VSTPSRRTLIRAGVAILVAATLAGAAAVAHAATSSGPNRPSLQIGAGILASPTSRDAYLVNMTIAPKTGADLTGPTLVIACNGRTCHTARGGGSLPIVNVPFSLRHPAVGAHVTIDIAACTAGYRCVRTQVSGVVPAN